MGVAHIAQACPSKDPSHPFVNMLHLSGYIVLLSIDFELQQEEFRTNRRTNRCEGKAKVLHRFRPFAMRHKTARTERRACAIHPFFFV